MNCQELHKIFQGKDIENKCEYDVRNFSGSFSNISARHNIDSIMSQDSICDASSDRIINFSNEAIKYVRKCTDEELTDNDLIEIQNIPSNYKSNISKNTIANDVEVIREKDNTSPLCENIFLNDNDIVKDNCLCNYNVAFECGEDNIENCLLELDNYLEKMDNSCFRDFRHIGEPNSLIIVPSKSICSSVGTTNSRFIRSSKLRNTISYTLNHERKENESVYVTGNKQAECGQLKERNTEVLFPFNTNLDIIKDHSHISTNDDKSKSTENSVNLNSQNGMQVLSNDQIFKNLIEQQETSLQNNEINRPRQFGRRAERLETITMPFNQTDQNCENMVYDNLRTSARSLTRMSDDCSNPILHSINFDSIESCRDSGESLGVSENNIESNITLNEEENNQQSIASINSENVDEPSNLDFNSHWPHNYSRTCALISCTLGLFNISRFAILTIIYGANFLIQFLIFSITFGVPFLWLQMSLGSKIKAGPISMWKISPICIGIGVSLIFVQYFISIYSSIVIVWLLIYLRDICIHQSSYPWSNFINPLIRRNSFNTYNNLTESIPDYLNVNVLQRLNILNLNQGNTVHLHVNNHVAFYMVILWAAIFLILCRGLKSFGKMVLLLGILPIIILAAVAVKLLFVVDFTKLQKVFSSEFDEFMVNSNSWTAAAQEAFLTWGVLGTSIISISSRRPKNSSKITLRSDAIWVAMVTLAGLYLSALVGLCSTQILKESRYIYVPGSYENPDYYSSIFSFQSSNSDLISYPTKFVPHYSTLIGDVYRRHTDIRNISGYQALRFITEVLPAVVVISAENISWIWTLIIFLTYLFFGVSQLCVMWKPISCALGNSTSAVLLSCVTGLLLSIPFATEIGIKLLHYMDILLGGAWFIPILWAAEILGVFLIRGRPYNSEELVSDLKMSGSISAFLALSWNVLLPIALIALAVIEYKISLSSQLYYWRRNSYFNDFSRKVGAISQIGFLLLVPISSIIQICRYLTSGPADILDRIQLLYRPFNGTEGNRTTIRINENIMYSRYHDESSENSGTAQLQYDAPPKYTPPPSYTTATGARLVKLLRQSLRRSVRRILGDPDRQRPVQSIQCEAENGQEASVLSRTSETENELITNINESIEIESRPSPSLLHGRSLSLGRNQTLNKHLFNTRSSGTFTDRPYTAKDVITILRSSTLGQRGASRSVHSREEMGFCSVENLVQNDESPNFSSAVISEYLNENHQNSTSVI